MREETLVKNIIRHKKVLEGMLTALTGDWNVAEDLFQEVAVVMTRKREEAREDCNFVAWGRAIAVNVVRDYRKKRARRKVHVLADDALESVAVAFEERDEPFWDARRQALKQCTEELPERERTLLRRRYEEAAPVSSLASWLSMSRGAVDTLLYRLRKALHQCVEVRVQRAGMP